jgi:hypothetical protein
MPCVCELFSTDAPCVPRPFGILLIAYTDHRGDGIYIVGTDITPGTYKNTASTNCYYARLSAFDTQAIISNNNTDAVAIITIAASDKGFQSNSCGTWTKQ